jgi:hypothetical protein
VGLLLAWAVGLIVWFLHNVGWQDGFFTAYMNRNTVLVSHSDSAIKPLAFEAVEEHSNRSVERSGREVRHENLLGEPMKQKNHR